MANGILALACRNREYYRKKVKGEEINKCVNYLSLPIKDISDDDTLVD